MTITTRFQAKVLAWFHQQGRKHLPWQNPATPYRVYISEVMLQQTQVATVIPYFNRFIDSFPDIQSLAKAPLDDVLHHWTGLGYYARARNLHRSAQQLSEAGQKTLPKSLAELETLPGIGRSTAGAIMSLGFKQPAAILDGNVKRVLARVFCVSGPSNKAATLKKLWQLSEQLTPKQDCQHYNQAMMDLGALICKRSKPDCAACPLASLCQAYQTDQTANYPEKQTKKSVPQKFSQFLIVQRAKDGAVLLEKRPAEGIWGGLYSFIECDATQSIEEALATLRVSALSTTRLATINHRFSHYLLTITPQLIQVDSQQAKKLASAERVWYNPSQATSLGLATPVKQLIEEVTAA